jgi:hypothetical protein
MIDIMKSKDEDVYVYQGPPLSTRGSKSSTSKMKVSKVMDFQKNYLRMTDLDKSADLNIDRALSMMPSIEKFNTKIPINRHQTLILRNHEESLDISMTSSKKEKVKKGLKQRIRILKHINQEKLKLSQRREQLEITHYDIPNYDIKDVVWPGKLRSKVRTSHETFQNLGNNSKLNTERMINPNELDQETDTKSSDIKGVAG